MTMYANTPAGRAAAAASRAATGTTMGRRPTGPKGPMVRPGVPSGPNIGVGPFDPKPARPIVPQPGRPRVPPGPKIGVRPSDPKPANPRITYGPPGKLPGTVGSAPISQQGASDLQGLNQMIAARGAISPMNMGPSPSFKKGGAVKSKAMRGGGLARKGVGMALAKGGLARRAGGCAKRGVGKGKIL